MGDETNSQQSIGKVIAIEGAVSAMSTAGERPLSMGSALYQGDTLITAEDSRVEIEFNDETRLSQGENSKISIDSYVYDETSGDNSGLLMNMVEGTFRCVTGKIVTQNPENFILKSPLATLGIRGTTTVSEIHDGIEKHGAENISSGKTMVLQDSFGTVRFITTPQSIVDFNANTPIGMPRSFTSVELNHFHKLTPLSVITHDENGSDTGSNDDGDHDRDLADDWGDSNESGDDNTPPEIEKGLLEENGDADDQIEPEPQTPLQNNTLYNSWQASAEPARIIIASEQEDTDTRSVDNEDEGTPGVNYHSPVAENLDLQTLEDTTVGGQLTATDADTPVDNLIFTQTTLPSHGNLVFNPDGEFKYTPNSEYFGEDSFNYTVYDPEGKESSGTVTIRVNAVIDNKFKISVNEDTTYSGILPEITTDGIKGQILSYEIVSQPSNGNVIIQADGDFTYTPNENFTGIDKDEFSFQVKDELGNIAQGTVSVSVLPVNDAPEAFNTSVTAMEDTIYTGKLSATDIDGDPLTFSFVNGPSHGQAVVESDGRFKYTPSIDYAGTDSFSFIVADDHGLTSNQGNVSVTVLPVNDPPVATNTIFTTSEDMAYTGTLTGSDVDGDTLTYSLSQSPNFGTVAINSAGSFTYTPDASYSGTDTFSYTVTDGLSDSSNGTITMQINAVNDPPVTENLTLTVLEDKSVTDLLTATDEEKNQLTFTLHEKPLHGTVVIKTNGEFTYTPDADYFGSDTFTAMVTDSSGRTDTATVNITVTNVNDAPVADNLTLTVPEDDSVTKLLTSTDADNDQLTYTLKNNPLHGDVVLNTNGQFTYTPDADYFGSDTFTATVTDKSGGTDEATVNITVTNVNDSPVADNLTITIPEDESVSRLLTSTDADNDQLTFTIKTNPLHGDVILNTNGQFTYTPDADYFGSDTFTATVTDSNGGTGEATVSITVTNVNDSPAADKLTLTVPEDESVTNFLASTDADNEQLTFTLKTNPLHGDVVLNTNGQFTYTPDADYFGSDTFTATVTDSNGSTDTATVDITVTSVNDSPVAESSTFTTDQNVVHNGQLSASDIDGDSLTFSLAATPSHGNVTIDTNGSFVFTPTTDYAGTDSFSFTVDDGHGSTANGTIDITVTDAGAANTAPTTSGLASTTPANTTLTETITATDPDGDTLTFSETTAPANGTLSLGSNGAFTYQPNTNYWGKDTFTYTVTDIFSNSTTGTVDIMIGSTDSADNITGTSGNDIIYGLTGDDTIDPGVGNDVVSGDAGNDYFIGTSDLNFEDTIDGGDGIDTLLFSDSGDDMAFDSVTNIEHIILEDVTTAITAPDTLIAAGETLTVDGSALSLSGGSSLFWDGSNESNGNLILTAGQYMDTLTGGDGNDAIYGGDGNDIIVGNDGNDYIDAQGEFDYIEGNAGNDTLIAGDEDDEIVGGAGNDLMTGGPGNDVFTYMESTDFGDVITDFNATTPTSDTIKIDVNYTGLFSDAFSGSNTIYVIANGYTMPQSFTPATMVSPYFLHTATDLTTFKSNITGIPITNNDTALGFGLIGITGSPSHKLIAVMGRDTNANNTIDTISQTVTIATLQNVTGISAGVNNIDFMDIILY